MLKKLELLYVEWYDHWAQGSWSQAGEDSPALTVCASIGWLYKEDKQTLLLASSLCEETGQIGNLQGIGKGLIRTRKVLLSKEQFLEKVK